METVIRYKVYRIGHGLLIEPMSWGTCEYSDYETMEEARLAIREHNKGQTLVILPVAFTRFAGTE